MMGADLDPTTDKVTPARELTIAVVGAGRMAKHHVRVISRGNLGARVVAVVDPDLEAANELASELSGALACESLLGALDKVQADVVHICSPPATHFSLAMDALAAGCHIYVEKPFASNIMDARLILDAARKLGLRICSGHQLLFEPPAREARSLISKLGKIQHIESYFSFRPVRGTAGQTPVSEVDQLLDILPHPVYLLLSFMELARPDEATNLTALELGDGTLHALLRRGDLSGSLVVSLTARPIENFVRIVGTRGSVTGDFVRSILVRHMGVGVSGIDKLLAPYQAAKQLSFRTTQSMIRRLVSRERSYPGLSEIFEAFYTSVRGDARPPISDESLLDTVMVQQTIAEALRLQQTAGNETTTSVDMSDGVLVTGGTGMLGRRIVKTLRAKGKQVRVLARRLPAEWNREEGVDYCAGDLSKELPRGLLDGISSVVHCAAATSGGWNEHQASSIQATERLIRGMASKAVQRLIHVSSLAVVEEPGGIITDSSPLLADPRAAGPYTWGKLESEKLAISLADEHGISVSIVRPAAIIDYEAIDPPGRLGRKLGNLFVAVGGRKERMGVVDLKLCARTIVDLLSVDGQTRTINVLDPDLPSRSQLVGRLKQDNPDLRVVWIPRWAVRPLSSVAWLIQLALRPKSKPISISAVFDNRQYDTGKMQKLLGKTEIRAPE